jgi:cell division protein FtsZ
MADSRRLGGRAGAPSPRSGEMDEPALDEESGRVTRRTQVGRWSDEKDAAGGPSYLRKRQALGQSMRSAHNPGQKDFTYDEDDFEIPTFIRTQAD